MYTNTHSVVPYVDGQKSLQQSFELINVYLMFDFLVCVVVPDIIVDKVLGVTVGQTTSLFLSQVLSWI